MLLALPGCDNREHYDAKATEARALLGWLNDASPIEDAINSEPINAITAGCTGLGLTKDCDSYSGANRIVTLKGIKMRVAGDESGGRILLMLHENECDLGQLACKTNASNRNYHIVKSIFMENNVTIIDVKALFTGNSIVGYSFFVDDDGYSLLN
jgi:hypothetical protein